MGSIHTRKVFRCSFLAVALAQLTACTRESAATLSFNESVQPVLSENCYHCHGPDKSARKAELRLDRGEFAFAPHGEYAAAIVPGDPDGSPLILRIEAKDPEERMPPPEAHKTLKPREIALLRQWIEEGAKYQEHWAFLAPVRPAVPAFPPAHPQSRWPRNDIDRFILARLEKEGLTVSREADRNALIRRVSFDLTGLPPTPAEVQAFLDDPSPGAYEKVVDRLLASERYGEHRAHYWLDVARYGDTHGLHLDNFRAIWPYRDYVVRSYNRNFPFDRFIREQLAGDMLPAATLDQLLASAYIRAGISSGEGGTLEEELRVNNQRERVEAFSAAFLGLTVGCAACHDHKFDPISQKDHYQLTAFFNNLTETPSNQDRKDWAPVITLPRPEKQAAYEALLAQRAALREQIADRERQAKILVARWLAQSGTRPQAVDLTDLEFRLRMDEQEGQTLKNSAAKSGIREVTATGAPPHWGEEVWAWPSMRMDTSTRIEIPEAGDFDVEDAFSVGMWMMPRQGTFGVAEGERRGSIVSRTDSQHGSRGWDLIYDEGKQRKESAYDLTARLAFRLVHAGDTNALSVASRERVLMRGRWNHVLAVYDGSGKAAGVRLYVDGKPIPVDVERDALRGTLRVTTPLSFGRQFPDAHAVRESRYQDFRIYHRALSEQEALRLAYEDRVAEIVQKPLSQWSEQEFKSVSDLYFSKHDPRMPSLMQQFAALGVQLEELSKGGEPAMVSEESPRLAYADVLTRGNFAQRAEKVRPGVPHFLPPMPEDAPKDRRGLADWVVSSQNPLTARVSVNRMWQEIFGTGLVETTENFGAAGERPSHPELLDWLAVDFRENGWDVKRFYKQLLMSATYRQSATASAQAAEKDPRNRLLSHGPRFRMDAEMLRDTALAVSGLLVEKTGGPSVKPYQSPGVWEEGSFPYSDTRDYHQDPGDSLYRRSLYTFWKRMATAPSMDAFDSPVRDAACTRRQRTNTPLQALVIMNDVQWLEAARKLAERALLERADDGERLELIVQALLSRSPTGTEMAAFDRALNEFRKVYSEDPKSAREVVAVGESPRAAGLAPAELAPWMLLASAVMNLDEALNK
jgi:hypothetical protein